MAGVFYCNGTPTPVSVQIPGVFDLVSAELDVQGVGIRKVFDLHGLNPIRRVIATGFRISRSRQ